MRTDDRNSLGSARTVRAIGLLLGLFVTAGMAAMLGKARVERLDGAQRHSQALATGVDRLLMYELRNLERAMTGIAIDSEQLRRTVPERAPAMLSESIAGVLSRHPELETIVLYDTQGHALTAGADDPALASWLAAGSRGTRPLVFGEVRAGRDGDWTLPIALRTEAGAWLVLRLRTAEFERMIRGLDTGREGSVAVLDRHGAVLARTGAPGAFVGRHVRVPTAQLQEDGTTSLRMVSQLDGIERQASFSADSGYPVVVSAGIALREAMAPWRAYAGTVAMLLLLYWLGWWFLVRRMRGAEAVQEAMLEELRANADWLRDAQLAARTGVYRVEPDPDNVRVSEQAAELFGFPASTSVVALESIFERVHPDDRPRVRAELAEAHAHRTPFRSEHRMVLDDGTWRWIVAYGALATDSRGNERMTGTISDITERRETMLRIESAESQLRELFECNPLPFWVFDVETLAFLAVNETAVRKYGYSREEFLAMTILDIRPGEDVEAVLKSMWDIPKDGFDNRVWVHVTRDGRRINVRVHSSNIEFAGRPARLVLAEDVSERIAYENDLAWRATHDVTTGMLTVPAVTEQVEALLEKAPDSRLAVAYVQLRDLDLVAPTLGRRAGETILQAAAERLGWIGRTYGFAAYRPADAFVIVALDHAQRDAMLAALVRAIASPVEGDGGTHLLAAWIGLADRTAAGESTETLIGNAALAALQARREHGMVMQFDAPMAAEANERVALAGRLRRALERREFELFLQPIHRLDDGSVVSLEALLRWPQADGSFVSPAKFIPLCEESGLIVPLGNWVLEESARCHRILEARGLGHLSIAVNVSAVQLLADSLPALLRDLHREHGLRRGALQVELTESTLLRRPNSARAVMSQLRDDGVRIAIDDFGTGYSSMAYLKALPLDYLKLDRAFVTDVDHDERNASICRALIALGHGLDLRIIAEGVEDEAQLAWLREQGCDEAQGYLLGRPAPLEDVVASIERQLAGQAHGAPSTTPGSH